MRTCLSLVVGACLLLAARPARADEEQKTFSVPFEMLKTQHMVVSVKVNGKGPYRLIFDTGAPDSLVSNKVAKEAGLITKDTKRPLFAPFGSAGQFKMKTLELGGLKAEEISTMVIDHPTVGAISSVVGPIEGILGFTFFARYKTTIDYEKKVLTFEPSDYRPKDVMQAMIKKLMAPRAERETPAVLAPAGLLGIQVTKDAKDEAPGVTVAAVVADSPAAAAGLKAGDRLLTLDRRWTDTVNDCYAAAGRLRPGAPASAVVVRDGKELELEVTVGRGL